jgi:hypothetical protein
MDWRDGVIIRGPSFHRQLIGFKRLRETQMMRTRWRRRAVLGAQGLGQHASALADPRTPQFR